MRIVVFGIDRSGSQIEACPIGRDDEINLVDLGQTLGGLDMLTRIGLVVILNDFDQHLLATNIQTAAGVDLL